MRARRLMNFVPLLPLGLMLVLVLTLSLMGCAATGTTSPSAAVTGSAEAPKVQHDARPLVCSEMERVTLHAGKVTADGKDDVQKQDVIDRLGMDDWEVQLRRLFGDTDSTIKASRKNNAVLKRLCG